MTYQPQLPEIPDPQATPDFDPVLWPAIKTSLPPDDLPTAHLFQRAYYWINLAGDDSTALAAAHRTRDALDDALAPTGFLAEPTTDATPTTALTFVTARLRATGHRPPTTVRRHLSLEISQEDLAATTPLPEELAALAPKEFRG